MTYRLRLSLALFASLLTACATGGDPADGSVQDDGSTVRDAGPERDGGGDSCPSGQHRCGGGCIADLENLPENGCRLGCGEPCPTPPAGVASCDEAGRCTVGCEPPFHLEGDECVCVPKTCEAIGYTCGAPDDGCGTPLDCGSCGGDGVCIDGTCSCPPDEREPNDSLLAIRDTQVEHIPDQNLWQRTYSSWSLHSADDVDWFRFPVTEDGTTNPGFTIKLDNVPEGSQYELSVYYVCNDGADESDCTLGSPCSTNATTRASGQIEMDIECNRGLAWDDSGVLYVRVKSNRWSGSCAPYTLFVESRS